MASGSLKYFFHTFGCRVNQYETEVVRERLLAGRSAADVPDWASADVCVINTCTVTENADRDALKLIRRIRRRNPAARLVVTGCMATRAPEAIREAAPEALVVGNDGKDSIPAMLGCSAPAIDGITGFAGHARAFVKVQDGCNMSCTYCIIPSVRPDLSSKPYPVVAAEVRGLLDRDYRELVLCGIRLGRYLSEDAGKRVDFRGLLERLLAIPGDFRIRLSSFEITDVTEGFIELAARSEGKLCPSFHLPLQSGSDAVLKKMERWYSAGFFRRRVEALRTRLPEAGLFTDVMVGFPGETEEDFEQTLRLLEDLRFCGLHIFPFSARRGTPAARMTPVPPAEIERRLERMRALDARLRAAFAARAVGARRRVLVEPGPRGVEGTAEDFLKVRLDRNPDAALAWVDVVRPLDGGAVYAQISAS